MTGGEFSATIEDPRVVPDLRIEGLRRAHESSDTYFGRSHDKPTGDLI